MRLISTTTLAEAIDVPVKILSQWVRRGIVRASGGRERVGMPRGWTVDEAVTLALFAERLAGSRSTSEAADEAMGMAAGTLQILNAPSGGPTDDATHIVYIVARWPDGRRDARLSLDLAEAARIAASGLEAGARVEMIDTLPFAMRVLEVFQQHAYDAQLAVSRAELARAAGDQALAERHDRPAGGSA